MHRGSWKSSSSPRIAGVQWSSTVGSTLWGMAPGMAWRCSEGPAGQGLVLVKAGAASEGRAHAVRGFRGGERLKDVWGVGSTVAGAVPSTSCTTSQVPTVSPQCPKWRSSDWSWRTGLRSKPLRGVAA